ncbi:energy transducer TonB [Methylogaea oryzae]|uniref:TonB C-terminal domain-containing protein n=2 Tax=Methylogaea oryzae TaxID=1295382 RepID=A0A8D4VRH5_9GAMM|nr:energy transducer TonB [Methylogaea oryzae]BBL72723.1 hypothetical protein MoryE10_33290 [Methylogaea oryzae]
MRFLCNPVLGFVASPPLRPSFSLSAGGRILSVQKPADPSRAVERGAGLFIAIALHLGALLLWQRQAPEAKAPDAAPAAIMAAIVAAPRPAAAAPKAEPQPAQPPKPIAKPLPPAAKASPARKPATPPPVAIAGGDQTAPAPSAESQAAPSVAAASAAASTANAAPLSPPRFDADYLNNPAPDYPEFARRQGVQGRVVVRVLVRADGSAEKADVRTSSGHGELDEAALDAVRRWRFVPARRGEEAVPASVLVPIAFSLEG